MKSYLLPVEDLVVVYANDEEFLKGKFVYTQREVLGIDIGLCYLNELDYINRLTITDENYYYDSYENSLVVFKSAGKTPMFFNKGHFCIQRLDQSPTLQTEGAMYFNRVTKKFMGYNGTNWIELG